MKILILFCKPFVHVACFELNSLDFFLFFVSFTGNYIDNFICDRVFYTTVGSGLSQCLCRNKRKATFCCSNLFNHRYAGGMNFFLHWCQWSLMLKIQSVQGLYRSWKSWKVMELKNFIFQAWKVNKFNCRSLKVLENESCVWQINYWRWQSKEKLRSRGVIKQCKWHAFWWTPEFVSVELFKVKKYAKTRKVLKIFKSDN